MEDKKKKLLQNFIKAAILLAVVIFGCVFTFYELAITKTENFLSFSSLVYILFSMLAALIFAYMVVYLRNLVVDTFKPKRRPALVQSADAAKKGVKVGLYFALILNVVFALMQLYFAILNQSAWFYCFFIFYLTLAFMRTLLAVQINKNQLGKNLELEYRWYRLCALIFMFINAVLAVITYYIAHQNRGFEYPFLLTLYMIGYTAWLVFSAIYNLLKYKKYNSPVLSALTWVNMVFALVSILILETCLFYTFGHGAYSDLRQTVTGVSGAVICTLIWIIAFFMIIDANFAIKKIRQAQKEEDEKWLAEQKEKIAME